MTASQASLDKALDLANDLFNACYAGRPTCPVRGGTNGAIAIVRKGVMISAPQVNASDLGSSPFQISGNFTKTEATDLARSISG